ncbi:anthrax toxin lethal factor-related metalloendopeptidase [Microscilla marina]|uniref:Anthrax toxin lethal/endema factor N-/C-terminal domain-containing protein n=1 Tax=Microscilla marina ATCC 23134 TaxID=313606 RepID=A1ZDQ4_MICM2|nr:hypothetical protein [Microscilla marina]EAY31212.1 hypothetical protein M23134_04045 [Microscilla marina ATCC 23134]
MHKKIPQEDNSQDQTQAQQPVQKKPKAPEKKTGQTHNPSIPTVGGDLPPIESKHPPHRSKHALHKAKQVPINRSGATSKPQHGVTLSAAKVKVVGQDKEVNVRAGVEVYIADVMPNGYVCQAPVKEKDKKGIWHTKPYQVLLPKAMVKVTPNQLSEIDPATRQQVVKYTNPNLKKTNQSLAADYSKATEVSFMHTPGIPKELRRVFEHLAETFFSDIEKFNEMMTFKIDFGQIPPKIAPKESPTSTKYGGKVWAYRFTSLRHADFEKTLLVEELGEVKQAPLTEQAEAKAAQLMKNYHISIHQPTAREQANSQALKQAVDASSSKVFKLGVDNDKKGNEKKDKDKKKKVDMKKLHAQSFLPFSPQDKTHIRRALLKMTPAMLERIAGVAFFKRGFACIGVPTPTGKTGQHVKIQAGWAVARYHLENHTISVYNGMINADNVLVFGDKGSDTFTPQAEEAIIHELGHAIDLKEVAKARMKRDQLREKHKKAPQDPQAKKAWEAQQKVYKNTPRLSGQTDTKRAPVYETEFSKAAQLDAPLLTKYSNKNDLENFAEAFALYITEPKTLQLLSPHVYQYFKTHYPKPTSDD